ncbi:MAG: response regulator [Elusimicrobia bacterium]|nr:response regulator [Elusimicrobiota bacterium]
MIAQILIADDNDELRGMLKEFLEMRGHRVLEATDGAQAFALAEKHRPHLIIMDIVMPGLYGSTALKQIQEYPGTSKIPIIILSGSIDAPIAAGIQDSPRLRFMHKPVDLKSIESMIRELLPMGGYTR